MWSCIKDAFLDPNFHSCGMVQPYGIAELNQPEPRFVIVGSKSYGRAHTFLIATGYVQVRSVVAEMVGDRVAAREVPLVLSETAVCSAPLACSASRCCGGPAPAGVGACCAGDAVAKENREAGCGCSEKPARSAVTAAGIACCRSAA